jgi:hypothetical protein
MNNTDPAIGVPTDQSVLAQNVEYVDSMLGERRLGTSAITLPSFLSDRDRVPFLFRHLPTADETAAELWALGVTGTTTAKLGRKTTVWSEITISDTPLLTGLTQYRWQAVTLHGKIHFAYDSDVDRLHVWDGTSMRRSGMGISAAPTAANAGSGSLSDTRYGRVRYVDIVGSTVTRRGEASAVKTFAPSGSGSSITWTKPATISEGETHWEIELSLDNSTFYRMSRIVVGTTTYSDTDTVYTSGTLSADAGDYTVLPSARYLTTDEDRLMWAGSWEDDDQASRVGWTPVFNATGDGNDERYATDTDPTLDLDTYEHGPITGISAPIFGAIWVFKRSAIYRLTRSGSPDAAYDASKVTDAVGAMHGSVLSGVDEVGQPCIYFIDDEQGPCRVGIGGIKRCGEDLRTTWTGLNVDATAVAVSGLYYPKKRQMMWNVATGASNTPDTRLVLHVDKARPFADGVRKGWTLWTGDIAKALSMCLFADNIEDNAARSFSLVPFIGLTGLGYVQRCETGVDDNGVTYTATVTTKPITMKSTMHQFGIRAASIMGKATTAAAVDVSCVRNFGLETTATVSSVTFTASGSETEAIKSLDDFKGMEMSVAQFTFTDITVPTAQWQLNRFDVLGVSGQGA